MRLVTAEPQGRGQYWTSHDIAEPGCASERAGCAPVPTRTSFWARHLRSNVRPLYMPLKRQLSLPELEEALRSAEDLVRYNAIYDFARLDVTIEAVPALLRALSDTNPGVVKCAADSLGKLGPAALNYGSQTRVDREVVWELLTAACRIDSVTHMPQAYPECLAALIQIAP